MKNGVGEVDLCNVQSAGRITHDNNYCVKCGSSLVYSAVQSAQPDGGKVNAPLNEQPANGAAAQSVASSDPAPSGARRGHTKLAMVLAIVIVAVVVVAGALILIVQPSSRGTILERRLSAI